MSERKRKGFTLAELLIVVAIIGVLVAISIPIFISQLKKARLATNQANVRAAYAAAIAQMMSEPPENSKYVLYIYSNEAGKIVDTQTPSSLNAGQAVSNTLGVSLLSVIRRTGLSNKSLTDISAWNYKDDTMGGYSNSGNMTPLNKTVFKYWGVAFKNDGKGNYTLLRYYCGA